MIKFSLYWIEVEGGNVVEHDVGVAFFDFAPRAGDIISYIGDWDLPHACWKVDRVFIIPSAANSQMVNEIRYGKPSKCLLADGKSVSVNQLFLKPAIGPHISGELK